uniref:RNA-directed DNA polymerase n=1 Tax=Cacopsylla melanoneura TaxID=428564 RepID=A0A8D8X1C6_9HEMI
MRLALLQYDLDVTYLPGRQMLVADLLSRNFIEKSYDNEIPLQGYVHNLYAVELELSNEVIIREGKLDENISKIIQYSIQGWPKNKSSLPKNEIIRHFAKLKEKLMVSEDGLLYYDNRVVIPETLKSSALKSLHSGHMGIQKTILRAKETMYWINMNNNIESYIKKCLTCQTFRGQKMKEPLQPIEISNFPFERISLDILTYNSKDYLVVVDSYSKWIELYRLKSKKCSEIISKLKNLFAIFGIPCIIQSDNSPFNSSEIKQYCKINNIKWWFSSPHYPNSNSSEQAVQICKTILKKSDFSQNDYLELLSEYRATKIPALGLSPSEIMMGRLIRTKIPINSHKLKPISGLGKIHHSLKTKMRQSQLNQKKYYDKKTRLEKPFQSGENVLVREGERWIRGKIIQSTEYPRSYWVKTEKGSKVRRNTLHLKHTPIIFEDCDTPDNFDDFLEIHCYKKSDTASSDATLIDQDDLVVPNLSTNT